MANLHILGIDTASGQYKRFTSGDAVADLVANSTNTTTEAVSFSGLSLTSGSLLRGTVPNSGFTGRLIDIRDNTGTPVDKFVVDSAGKITVGSADASLFTSGTLGVTRGGTGLSTIASGKILYTSSSNTLAELSLDSTLGIGANTLSVQADTVVQKLRVSSGGTLQGTRREVNFVQGSNVTLTVADDGANNRVNVTIAASAAAGSRWDQISDPTTNLALTMAANTTAFTWGNATSTSNLFTLADGASNTGTGYIFSVNSASSSAAKPLRVAAGGTSNGIEMTTAGVLQVIGSGGIVATALNGVSANGIQTRTSAGTFTSRSITTASSARIAVTNGDGVSGNPTIDLATVTQGSAGTALLKVTIDSYGRISDNTAVSASDIGTIVDSRYVTKATNSSLSSGVVITYNSATTSFNDDDLVPKRYVDGVAAGLSYKAAVRVASTANVTISNPGTAVFDGVTLSNGDRVLLKDQSTASQNGVYLFNGSGSAMTRTTDADTSSEVVGGMTVWVNEGTANADTAYTLITNNPITLGTTALTFTQTSGLGQVNAGAGLTKTGSTIDVVTASSGRIVVNADSIDLATTGVAANTYIGFAVDAYGRITGATPPTTLAGYGITDAQALDADLTAIAALSGTGILARTASNTWAQRTITGTSNRIVVTNGDGISGNPALDVGTDIVTLTGTQTLTNKTLTSPVVNFGSDANGDIIVRQSGNYNRLAAGATAQVLSINGSGIPAWVNGLTVLSTTTGIDAKTTGTTNLYTVPSGKKAIIKAAIVVPTAASSITQGPVAGIGIAAGEDDVFASTQLTGMTTTSKMYTFDSVGTQVIANATEIIKLGIDTAATGTSMTVSVYLIGFLI